jgi:hypothetical protein
MSRPTLEMTKDGPDWEMLLAIREVCVQGAAGEGRRYYGAFSMPSAVTTAWLR